MDSYYQPEDGLQPDEMVAEQIVITRALNGNTDENVIYVDTYPERIPLPTFLGLCELGKDFALNGDDDDE